MAVFAPSQINITDPLTSHPLRFITATSLFDGHDAAINVIRRLLQDQGVEVIHLGHNRSVDEIVNAALQEDVDGIAISSYQGGHMEFFKFLLERLQTFNAGHIAVFGGGGGTITNEEINQLQNLGVIKVYSPEDGRTLGLTGMAEDILQRTQDFLQKHNKNQTAVNNQIVKIAKVLSKIERDEEHALNLSFFNQTKAKKKCAVIGFTGTGGSGKSTVIDEMLMIMLREYPNLHFALLAIDPTRQKTGGALLGDRIRMNCTSNERVYMRSMATRREHSSTNVVLKKCIEYLRSLHFGLVIVETAGIGQADYQISDLADLSVYVMTSDYGASGQLEKISMIDYADFIVLNKFDKRGAEDAIAEIRKQWCRNHQQFEIDDDEIPVIPAIASQLNDLGISNLCKQLTKNLSENKYLFAEKSQRIQNKNKYNHFKPTLIPKKRIQYLSEIFDQAKENKKHIDTQIEIASKAFAYYQSLQTIGDPSLPKPLYHYDAANIDSIIGVEFQYIRHAYQNALDELDSESLTLLRTWQKTRQRYTNEQYEYKVRDNVIRGENYTKSISQLQIPKVVLPDEKNWGSQLKYLLTENVPGSYPYTAGVYPYRREYEEPTRLFAGEGTPERTNKRFHYLIRGQPTIRLSTAFDPIALYGQDPMLSPDIYGRVGMSGVSIATIDDMKKLYSGIDLCDPNTSVSMTINGPAPAVLAMFMNVAIDQQIEKYLLSSGHWQDACEKISLLCKDKKQPTYNGVCPADHNGLGLGLLGVSGDQVVDQITYRNICKDVFKSIRGTVQADILKEDQAQNECIFSVECSMQMMGDIQQFFIDHNINNFYSVSVSGYHIAEAGANPITQLAFTLVNGFTLLEYYLSRGMHVDEIAPNFSFFFSNGMDPEYAVIGRVARRIWARAIRYIYKGNARSQMLKYHIQTSGRSLHAQDISFNDIRTTLQALYAINDNCNSLHTNAYDEAVTTPTEESVRRALAIQMIINKELGLIVIENALQGSFAIEKLTNLVEQAVLEEFEQISRRGGVLGAMEFQYQRHKIQEQSLYYENCKHDGSLSVVGVNTFIKEDRDNNQSNPHLIRSSNEEKTQQVHAVELFKSNHINDTTHYLNKLQNVISSGENSFNELMNTVKYCSLGQITDAIKKVGGEYRRRV